MVHAADRAAQVARAAWERRMSMLINVKSNIVRRYPAEITLKADKFCVDPKSALGVLAILYSARDNMMLDTGDMDDGEIPQLVRDIKDYIKE